MRFKPLNLYFRINSEACGRSSVIEMASRLAPRRNAVSRKAVRAGRVAGPVLGRAGPGGRRNAPGA